MGFKFRQRIKIAPGIHINIGKTGITSASIGKAGATLNVGKKGVKATAGIPGTGLSYTSGNLLAGQKNSTGKYAENLAEQAPERLGFFSESTLLEDVQDDTQPPRPLVMVLTHKQFRKLSTEEKKAFKSAGGKVKFSIGEKIFILAVIIFALGWLSDRHPSEKNNSNVAQEVKSSANN
ncbi:MULTISPECIES: DUF4236 domain-containing protein [Enterobacterales]|jgi:hypothetical protein|uniref:DUF4236 domain-containing protein n=1 Tax=Enterobacterales TaxID=91347 RepID=UPI0015E9E77C|nr:MULTISPECIES: DUF4236 domain-containing protein [Enterobacterales]MCE9798122.1 DUF4236 domain-containing protein [Citrobacter portucalensis]MCQ4169760.1 DUF4236 domain-containing protein [Hafnia paralvei]MEB1112104.1 DUF4236 domain-containing protein [Citrobacter portucalensis]QLW74316.1 DUF4236 domain-containing protein [Citrobacter freundii]WFZ31465.1 DUF4236 domain-containing protein [Citrobacter portucalensis]